VVNAIEWLTHDPLDDSQLSFMGVAPSGEGVYLNRALWDADLVIPLSMARLPGRLDRRGRFAGLYPTYSAERTIERFRMPRAAHTRAERRAQRKETDQAAWMLGVRLVVDVVPAAGGQVLHVVAGDVDALAERSKMLSAEAWAHEVADRVRLVVASVGGDQPQQTWDNVARALVAAERVVTDDGVIALCTNLAEEPGPSLSKLSGDKDLAAAWREIQHDATPDARVAAQVARSLRRGTVYLLSQLDAELVESLGFAPVEAAGDIARLAKRFDSCILLADAQYARPTVVGE
jgi:nickel-dependent lactate racemase